jgi:oligoendopeptidase F
MPISQGASRLSGEDFVPGNTASERSAIPHRYKWDLTRVFEDWQAWEREFAAVASDLPRLIKRRGSLGESAAALREAVEDMLDLRCRLEVIVLYASLRSDEDTRISENTARRGRASTLAVRYAEAASWFEPELLATETDRVAEFLQADPRLRLYTHFLDNIRRLGAHTLDPEREALLAAAANMSRGAGQVFNALNNADIRFGAIRDEEGREVELTKARFHRYIKSLDRRVRRETFERCLDSFGALINTLAANMDSNIKNDVFYARARRYAGALEAALYPDAVPTEVYHNLLASMDANLGVAHRYVSLKKRILGLEPLLDYDLYVPLFPHGGFKYGYEEARELMLAALTPLGPEYLDIVREGFTARWIDVHESAGKRSGAYSNGAFGTSPYILMNWSEQLRDTFTLAHEMGHSVHTYLACRNQPYVYADYPIFTAEVASTCNEQLLMHHLLAHTRDQAERLYLLDYYLTQINDIFVRQTMFAEFEHRMHQMGEQGETLTAETLNVLYLEMLHKYWGPDVHFDPERSTWNWSRIPHFYYGYYVYQYATAYAAAVAISRNILAGDKAARDLYLDALRSGSSRYPIETLQRAGVDMTQPEPIQDIFRLFSELLDEVEDLLGEEKRR